MTFDMFDSPSDFNCFHIHSFCFLEWEHEILLELNKREAKRVEIKSRWFSMLKSKHNLDLFKFLANFNGKT